MKLSKSVRKEFMTVTSLSKFIALLLFILLPFTGFFFGMQYQQIMDQNQELIDAYKWNSYKTEQEPAHTPLGTFSGILPCDNCDGVQSELTLFIESKSRAPRTFVLKETFLGTSRSALETSGNWNIETDEKTKRTIYRLNPDNRETPIYYEKQSDDSLLLLDKNKKRFKQGKNYSLTILPTP